MGSGDELPVILVTISLTLPLLVIITQVFEEVEGRCEWLVLGSWFRRFRLVGLPFILPKLLHGLAMCFPWAVLSAMLAEMATGSRGLGLGLSQVLHYGLTDSLSYIIVVTIMTFIPYEILIFCSRQLRKRFCLGENVMTIEPIFSGDSNRGLSDLVMVCVVVIVSWVMLHSHAPYIVPSLRTMLDYIHTDQSFLALLLDALRRTLLSILLGLIFGICAGALFALVGYASEFAHKFIVKLLTPLQFLPLIVFVPLLARLQAFLELTFPYDNRSLDIQVWPWLTSLFSGTLIATLACMYVAYHSVYSRLAELPEGLGPMVRTRQNLDLRVVRYIYLPWLFGSLGTIMRIALPRVFLAIFISEYLISNIGIGGLLWRFRGERDYMGTWGTLLITVFLITLMFVVVDVLESRQSRYLKFN
ncbi:MAG: ABC transporter permease subunit [Pseudomonadota bacterium]